MFLSPFFQEQRLQIDDHLKKLLTIPLAPPLLAQAAGYSLFTPGNKRLRPLLLLATIDALDGDTHLGLTAACCLEMIHTYSLIHDDLPCMDDDDFRRGKPSLHKAFNESTAVLAGDFLLTYAFEMLAQDENLSFEQRIELIQVLSKASGATGLIGGQVLDLQAEGATLSIEELQKIHRLKTGALLTAAMEMGAIVASASPIDRKILSAFGETIGLAFQVVDDLLDVTASVAKKGRAVSSDVTKQKATYVSHLGFEGAQKAANQLLDKALAQLRPLSGRATLLQEVALWAVKRPA
jgi:geranylgeranyl pyrophosphate synthase